jgi:hypothetical protein
MPSFGVTGNTLKDVSGNGNDGTLTNMDAASDWVGTSKGLALDFDGSNDFINVDDPGGHFTRSGSDDLTLSCWIKPITKSGYQTLIGNPQNTLAAANFNYLLYRHTSAGTVQLHGVQQNQSSFVPVANKWTHIVATVKSNTYRLYADSILVQEVFGFSYRVSFSTGRLSFGAYLNGFDHYKGSLSNISIYHRALSPSEIKQLYLNPSAPFERKQQTVGISTAQAFNPYWANQATQLAGTLQ